MLEANNTTIIAIDIQEKLVNMLENKELISANCYKLLKTAQILDIDTILTEQYPKGLGSTIKPIKEIKEFKTIEKTSFSACKTDLFKVEFDKLKNKNVVIFGIESHICVLQTVIDLIKEGYNVFVVRDCTSSRSTLNFETSLELMKQEGAKIVTLEIILFEFLKSSKHPNFKELQALIK